MTLKSVTISCSQNVELEMGVKPLEESSSSRTLMTLGGSDVRYSPATIAPEAFTRLRRTYRRLFLRRELMARMS